MEKPVNKKNSGNIEIGLIIASVVILGLFIIFMIINPESTVSAIGSVFNKMSSVMGPIFEVVAFGTFLVGLYLGLGKYGKVRLGDCKP